MCEGVPLGKVGYNFNILNLFASFQVKFYYNPKKGSSVACEYNRFSSLLAPREFSQDVSVKLP